MVVSCELPSDAERRQIASIAQACKAELALLPSQDDDVVGELRMLRFLRARHGNEQEATEWFRDFLRWRVTEGIDEARKEVVGKSPEEFLEWFGQKANPYLPVNPYVGRTKDGHVVWIVRQGMTDAKKFAENRSISVEEDARTFTLALEWTLWHLNELSRKEGRLAMVVRVGDFKGLGEEGRKMPVFVPEMKRFIQMIIRSFQKNYCEHDSCFLIVNTPLAFRIVFGIISVLLTKRQREKLRMLGDVSAPGPGRAAMAEVIQEELRPKAYGGARERVPFVFPLRSQVDIDAWYGRQQPPSHKDDKAPSPPQEPQGWFSCCVAREGHADRAREAPPRQRRSSAAVAAVPHKASGWGYHWLLLVVVVTLAAALPSLVRLLHP